MNQKNWMLHLEFVVMFMTLLGGFYTLDNKIERLTQQQSQRTDRLYEMWCTTQEEIKNLRLDMNREYYELKQR